MTTNKDKSNKDKEVKTFCGLPEIMIGTKETTKIKGIHLFKPSQDQLNEGKEFALEKNLNKVFIYNCLGTYTGVDGQGFNNDEIRQELNKAKIH